MVASIFEKKSSKRLAEIQDLGNPKEGEESKSKIDGFLPNFEEHWSDFRWPNQLQTEGASRRNQGERTAIFSDFSMMMNQGFEVLK